MVRASGLIDFTGIWELVLITCCVIRCETSIYVLIIIILYSFVFWVESREKERDELRVMLTWERGNNFCTQIYIFITKGGVHVFIVKKSRCINRLWTTRQNHKWTSVVVMMQGPLGEKRTSILLDNHLFIIISLTFPPLDYPNLYYVVSR